MAWGSQKKSGGGCGGLAFLALLVALLALWVAWSAYRRTGGTLDMLVKTPVAGPAGTPVSGLPAESEDWRAALDRARAELLSRRDEIEQNRDLEAVQRDIAEVRKNLESAWHGAGDKAEEIRDTWQGFDADLERLQGQVREKSRKAQETLDDLARRMKEAG